MRLNNLKRLYDLTVMQNEAIKDKNAEKLLDIIKLKQDLIDKDGDKKIEDVKSREIIEKMSELDNINKELLKLYQNEVLKKLNEINKGKQAYKAYFSKYAPSFYINSKK